LKQNVNVWSTSICFFLNLCAGFCKSRLLGMPKICYWSILSQQTFTLKQICWSLCLLIPSFRFLFYQFADRCAYLSHHWGSYSINFISLPWSWTVGAQWKTLLSECTWPLICASKGNVSISRPPLYPSSIVSILKCWQFS
jgi:hypothetical protein